MTLDSSPHFIQFVADNVDHNVRTLDSKNTFHLIIAAFSPRTRTNTAIKRVDVTSKDIAAVGHINIDRFTSEEYILHYMFYEHLSEPKRIYPHLKLDLIWKISPLLRISRPLWSGFMQTVYKGDHPPASSVMLFPVVDLDPHDLTCIHSTLSLRVYQQIQEWKENDYHVELKKGAGKLVKKLFDATANLDLIQCDVLAEIMAWFVPWPVQNVGMFVPIWGPYLKTPSLMRSNREHEISKCHTFQPL